MSRCSTGLASDNSNWYKIIDDTDEGGLFNALVPNRMGVLSLKGFTHRDELQRSTVKQYKQELRAHWSLSHVSTRQEQKQGGNRRESHHR